MNKEIRISFKVDNWDATWITNKIYRLIEKYKVKANINANPGSLNIVIIIIGVGTLMLKVQKDFIDYINMKRIRRKNELSKIKIEFENEVKYI